jgi:hypothetical protein
MSLIADGIKESSSNKLNILIALAGALQRCRTLLSPSIDVVWLLPQMVAIIWSGV